ncbi:MAG: methyl-accepting chemotaxis protein [Actinobacteria bacterium]|nr:methyl-accepting chemotaxis protein [Actinomycetota bacterium]
MSDVTIRPDARRRLAILYVGALIATVLVSIGRGFGESWASDRWVSSNTMAALIVGPPLIYMAYRIVSRGFQACLDATTSSDDSVRQAAIERGLGLPGKATKAYLLAWAIGQPAGLAISLLMVTPSRAELVTYVTDFLGLIPVAGFPVYAIVESQMRPVLRALYAGAGDGVAAQARRASFGIPLRVGLAMGSLVVAILMFLDAKSICEAFGADTGNVDTGSYLLVQLPVFALITLMVGASVTVSLRGSISEVEGTLGAAAEGDLRRRAAVTTTDELGALMADVDRMLSAQAKLIRSSVEIAADVSLSATAVADGSEQSSQGVAEIAHAMQDVVTGAQTQFEQIGAARAATDVLGRTIDEAGDVASQAKSVAAGAHELADEGARSAGQASEAMRQMQTSIAEATAAVDRLGGDTADIGTIVDSIVAIAGQTNMLALNAAIEAARAGDAGRGFGVVAEEVRTLASESNDAAARIADLIRDIRHTVAATVEAVNQGNAEVQRGVGVVDTAGSTFGEIAVAIEQIDDSVGEVNERTGEVAMATTAVADAVAEILAVTESVAALAEQTSANTEEASASSEEITSSADTLRETAHELERQIAAFKV